MDIWLIAFVVLVVLAAVSGAALVVVTARIRKAEQQAPAAHDQVDPDALTPPHGIPVVADPVVADPEAQPAPVENGDGARHRAPEWLTDIESLHVMLAVDRPDQAVPVPHPRTSADQEERAPEHAAGR